jgi:ribosome-associated translation inhibitor RaiA
MGDIMTKSGGHEPVVRFEGHVPRVYGDYAVKKVRALGRFSHGPALNTRITLRQREHRAGALPASAQVCTTVDGDVLYARADAATMLEAIDQTQARLRTQLVRHGHRHGEGRRNRTVKECGRAKECGRVPEAVPVAPGDDCAFRLTLNARTGRYECAAVEPTADAT